MDKMSEEIKHNWLRENWIIVGIILIATVIRLYFLWITKNQTVWWDSAEGLLYMKHIVLGTPISGFANFREVIIPYVWAGIYFFFRSEIAIQVFQMIISVLTVIVVYYLGKTIYDKTTGIIASIMMSVFWLHLFFTYRLLTYLYPPLLYPLILLLFYKGYCAENPKDKYLFLSFVTIIVGIGIYSSVVLSTLVILLYLFFTEKFSFLKNKRLWKYGLLSLPFILVSFIPSYLIQGSLLPRLTQMSGAVSQGTGLGLKGLLVYVTSVPTLIVPIWIGLAILSMLLIIRIFFYSDLILKNIAPSNVKKDLFIFLGFIVFLGFYTYVAIQVGGFYDGWIISIFPFLFILIARTILEIKDYISTKNINYGKSFMMLILIVLAFSCYQQLQFANMTIVNKIPSYYNLHPAGEWLKEHTNPNETILASSVPQLTYYSERNVISFQGPINETFQQAMERIYLAHPKYLVLTIWERSPEWAYSMPVQLNYTIEKIFYINPQQPDIVIYEIKYNGG